MAVLPSEALSYIARLVRGGYHEDSHEEETAPWTVFSRGFSGSPTGRACVAAIELRVCFMRGRPRGGSPRHGHLGTVEDCLHPQSE